MLPKRKGDPQAAFEGLRERGCSDVARVRGLGGCVDLGQVASPSEQLHLPSLEVIQSPIPQA